MKLLDRAEAFFEGEASRPFRAALAGVLGLVGIFVYARYTQAKYPIADWLVWRLGRVWAYTLWLNLACVSCGLVLLRKAFRVKRLPPGETLLMSMAVGLVAFTLGMYALGALGLFRSWSALGLAALMTLAGARELYRLSRAAVRASRNRRPSSPTAALLGWLAAGLGFIALALLYLQTLTPDAVNFDASWYHIPIAQDYAREGALVRFPSDYNRAFPHLMSVAFTWGFLVPGLSPPLQWMTALHLEYAIVVWKLVGAAAGARWLLGNRRVPGIWAAFFLFPSLFVYDQNPGGSADHFMGFWCVPVFLALVRALPKLDYRFCALVGLTTGGALLTKYQAVYMIAAAGALLTGRIGWLLAMRLRGHAGALPLRRLGCGPLIVAGVGLAVAAPHLIKNAVFYANPLYPLAQSLFPSNPSHAKSALFFKEYYPNHKWLPQGTQLERLATGVRLFFTFSFEPHYSFTKNYLSMGSLYTLLLPGVVLLKDKKRLLLAIAAGFLAMLAWSNTYIVDRYLQALVPLFVATTAAMLVRLWELGWPARVGLVPLVLFQLVYSGDAPFYSGDERIAKAITLITSGFDGKRTDEQRFGFRAEHRKITNATPKSAVIVARNYRTTLGIDRVVLSDIQAWQSYLYYEPLRSPRELYDLYKSRGVTHILFPRGTRPASAKQADVLIGDLIHHYGTNARRFGSLELVELPAEPPPEAPLPYLVLVSSIAGYPDGIYPVEKLDIQDRAPKHLRTKPRPEEPIPAAEADKVAALDRVQAVLSGKSPRALAQLTTELDLRFDYAERFKDFDVRVKKQSATGN